jgi:acyl-CoA hydrolase
VIAIKAKTMEQSKVSIGSLMQPDQANHSGNMHGGEIAPWNKYKLKL